jgi:hypothetical protein
LTFSPVLLVYRVLCCSKGQSGNWLSKTGAHTPPPWLCPGLGNKPTTSWIDQLGPDNCVCVWLRQRGRETQRHTHTHTPRRTIRVQRAHCPDFRGIWTLL